MSAENIRTAALPPPDWDDLTGTSPLYLGSGWMRFVDSGGGADPRYTTLTRGGRAVAALAAHWNPDEGHADYRAQSVLGGSPHPAPPRLTLGGRRGFSSGLLKEPSAGPRRAAADLAALLTDTLANTPHSAGRWWWPYLTSDDADIVTEAARLAAPGPGDAGVQLRLLGADCVMDLTGDSVDAFTAALPTKQRRTNFRGEQRRYAESGLRTAQLKLSDVWEEGAGLLAQVQSKYGHDAPVDYLKDFLRRQVDQLDDRSVVFAAYRGDDLIGFTLCFVAGDELVVRLNGFDYARLTGCGEYAHLTVHEPLRHCYANGLRRLHLGMDSYDAKCRRGARVRPLWAVVGKDPGRDTTSTECLNDLLPRMPAREAAAFRAEVARRLTLPDDATHRTGQPVPASRP
ncbi:MULTISPECIES: GNAT family N-acetyltransferase [unclassified Streptomyces]|uniref:GNAT family N-acetyltransferase n=1 Tax=unclassified Streptomyces TaxID=2593676 RepID=UPI002DD87DA7|nr:GNAT family N-acetyltransferase [Streptomyces sp. NBC_01257]WRZ68292.1 GNAT family N-acetyltransferase [Streptomyces sp. NBC_01257]